jgi:hypothetical protein
MGACPCTVPGRARRCAILALLARPVKLSAWEGSLRFAQSEFYLSSFSAAAPRCSTEHMGRMVQEELPTKPAPPELMSPEALGAPSPMAASRVAAEPRATAARAAAVAPTPAVQLAAAAPELAVVFRLVLNALRAPIWRVTIASARSVKKVSIARLRIRLGSRRATGFVLTRPRAELRARRIDSALPTFAQLNTVNEPRRGQRQADSSPMTPGRCRAMRL